MNARELRAQRGDLIDLAETLVDKNDGSYQAIKTQIDRLTGEIEKMEGQAGPSFGEIRGGGPNYGQGQDAEDRSLEAYFRGDRGSLADLNQSNDDFDVEVKLPSLREMRAVDSTMNITTAADGKNVVPLGFSQQIALRMSEIAIDEKLGCRPVPGVGTTVSYPYENASPNQFAVTSEQADDGSSNDYERDAMVFGSKDFQLVKYTKKFQLTEELVDDQDADLLGAVADHIGRSIAATRNSLLITEINTNGTSLKTFAAAAAIAAGEPEDIVYHADLAFYLDDSQSNAWVMRPPTLGEIQSLTGNTRQYASFLGENKKELLGYPVYYSNSVAAIAASAKSLVFGNFYYMGRRLAPALKLIRDPYSIEGVVELRYSFRCCFGILQSAAIGYAAHPSA